MNIAVNYKGKLLDNAFLLKDKLLCRDINLETRNCNDQRQMPMAQINEPILQRS